MCMKMISHYQWTCDNDSPWKVFYFTMLVILAQEWNTQKYREQRKEKNTRILQEKNNLGHHEKELINQQMSTK